MNNTCEKCKHINQNNGGYEPCDSCSQFYTDCFEPKPVKEVIDLTMMIGSNIDMEFSQSELSNQYVGLLKEITNNDIFYVMPTRDAYKRCRIRQDHWHSWPGGENPLPKGLEVILEYQDKSTTKTSRHTDSINWHRDSVNCIRAFKVIRVAEGYRYEWEDT